MQNQENRLQLLIAPDFCCFFSFFNFISVQINFNELIAFAEQKGVRIQNLFQGYDRREINSVADFLVAVQDTMLINVKRVFMTVRRQSPKHGVQSDRDDSLWL